MRRGSTQPDGSTNSISTYSPAVSAVGCSTMYALPSGISKRSPDFAILGNLHTVRGLELSASDLPST